MGWLGVVRFVQSRARKIGGVGDFRRARKIGGVGDIRRSVGS